MGMMQRFKPCLHLSHAPIAQQFFKSDELHKLPSSSAQAALRRVLNSAEKIIDYNPKSQQQFQQP